MRAYPATNHNLIKALERADVVFPIAKSDLIKRMEGRTVRIGWDTVVAFNEYIRGVQIDYFETKGQLFAALAASLANLDDIVL